MKNSFKISAVCCAALAGASAICGLASVSAQAYTNTQEYVSRLLLAPTVVAETADVEAYRNLFTAQNKPRSVVLGVGQGNLTAEDGASVGEIAAVFAELAENAVLPIVRVQSRLQAQTLADAVNAHDLRDFAVTGDDIEMLESAKELLPAARVYADFSAEERFEVPYDYIAKCREAGGNVVILSPEQADYETVYYLQSMLTTVWVRAERETEFGFAEIIASGAYGIVAHDYAALFGTYDRYPVSSLSRGFYNVGHRGLPVKQNSNTLESCIAAYEAGATHVEIDIWATADDELVIMHDASIDGTTDGTGVIANMTLAELKRYRVIKNIENKITGIQSEIPTLGEIFEYFKGKDLVVVVEIKDPDPDVCRLLKECIEEYGVQDQTVCISFSDGEGSQLQRMHEIMPSLPIATLLQVTEENCDVYLDRAARWNLCFDPSYSQSYTAFANSNFKDRGYMAWQWTYEDPSPIELGITGITNNHADVFGVYTKKIIPSEALKIAKDADLSQLTFPVTKLRFNGEREEAQAKVFMSEKTEGGYRAILYCEDKNEEYYSKIKVYSQAVFIAEEQPKTAPKGGNEWIVYTAIGVAGAVVAAGVATALIVIKKKNGFGRGNKNKE